MGNVRVLIDTNVLISAALFSRSIPGKALNFTMKNCAIVCSSELVGEYKSAIGKKELDKYTSRKKRTELLEAFTNGAEFINITGKLHIVRDKKDDKVLETAVAGDADFLITGDDDLLVLKHCGDVNIVTPRQFIDKVK